MTTEYCEVCGCNGGGVYYPPESNCDTVAICTDCLTRLRAIEEAAENCLSFEENFPGCEILRRAIEKRKIKG